MECRTTQKSIAGPPQKSLATLVLTQVKGPEITEIMRSLTAYQTSTRFINALRPWERKRFRPRRNSEKHGYLPQKHRTHFGTRCQSGGIRGESPPTPCGGFILLQRFQIAGAFRDFLFFKDRNAKATPPNANKLNHEAGSGTTFTSTVPRSV